MNDDERRGPEETFEDGATSRAQRPVELGETMRPRRRSGRLIAAALVVAVVAGAVAIQRGRHTPSTIVVAPTSTPHSHATRPPVTTPADCAAASLVLASMSNERLHPDWLPPGYTLTQGDETQLGQTGGLTYTAPGGGDGPRVELLRYHSTTPLSQLFLGTPQPTVVQGHPGIFSVATSPPAPYAAILWNPSPGIALVVNGYKIDDADLRKIADNVRYSPGAPFTYPIHPAVTVTRKHALAALGTSSHDAHAALTSFGEFSAIEAGATFGDTRVPLTPDVAVTQPVWVAWTPSRDRADLERAIVIDAQSGRTITTIAHIGPRPIDSITNRARPGCAPPFGVLTRSEATFLAHPLAGVTTILKLATEGTIDSHDHQEVFQCEVNACDPSVPIWVVIQEAPNQTFVNEESGPPGRPKSTARSSFSITMIDARTGPQNTNFSSELGPGRPPANELDIPDLEP